MRFEFKILKEKMVTKKNLISYENWLIGKMTRHYVYKGLPVQKKKCRRPKLPDLSIILSMKPGHRPLGSYGWGLGNGFTAPALVSSRMQYVFRREKKYRKTSTILPNFEFSSFCFAK